MQDSLPKKQKAPQRKTHTRPNGPLSETPLAERRRYPLTVRRRAESPVLPKQPVHAMPLDAYACLLVSCRTES